MFSFRTKKHVIFWPNLLLGKQSNLPLRLVHPSTFWGSESPNLREKQKNVFDPGAEDFYNCVGYLSHHSACKSALEKVFSVTRGPLLCPRTIQTTSSILHRLKRNLNKYINGLRKVSELMHVKCINRPSALRAASFLLLPNAFFLFLTNSCDLFLKVTVISGTSPPLAHNRLPSP